MTFRGKWPDLSWPDGAWPDEARQAGVGGFPYFPVGYFDTGAFPEHYFPSIEEGVVAGTGVATMPAVVASGAGLVWTVAYETGGTQYGVYVEPRPALVTGIGRAVCPSPVAKGRGEYQKFSDKEIEEIIALMVAVCA